MKGGIEFTSMGGGLVHLQFLGLEGPSPTMVGLFLENKHLSLFQLRKGHAA
jgi:hypothetical protein